MQTESQRYGGRGDCAERLNGLTSAILGAAIRVHRSLGPGLLESVYETCLEQELANSGLAVRRQVPVPVVYGPLEIKEAFRIDLLVEESVVIELRTGVSEISCRTPAALPGD